MKAKTFFLGLDFWFVIATLIYWVLVFLGFGFGYVNQAEGTWWANLLGLFVPFGPSSVALLTSKLLLGAWGNLFYFTGDFSMLRAIIALFLVVIVVIFGEKWLRKNNFQSWIKVLINLTVLLTLTLIVDLLLTGQWMSWSIFQHSLSLNTY